jgi:hypothetical protein
MKENIKQKLECNKCSKQVPLGQETTITWGETKATTSSGICYKCGHYVSLYCPRETIVSYSAKYCQQCFKKEHKQKETKKQVIVWLVAIFIILAVFVFLHYSEKRSAAGEAKKETYITILKEELKKSYNALADYELQVQELEERLESEPDCCSNYNPCLKNWEDL